MSAAVIAETLPRSSDTHAGKLRRRRKKAVVTVGCLLRAAVGLVLTVHLRNETVMCGHLTGADMHMK